MLSHATGGRRPRIAILFAGGTLEAEGSDRLDLSSYFERPRSVTGAEVLARVPEINRCAEVAQVELESRPSPAIDAAWWLHLARLMQRLVEDDEVAGVVVAHGTNTLEETAYFLHLTVRTRKPIVLTGSIRPSTAMSNDGDLNLFDAVLAAASPRLHGAGVVVVLNSTIHSAREVTKAATYRTNAFEGRNTGPLGWVDSDHDVVVRWHPRGRHTFATAFSVLPATLPRVDLTVSYVDATGDAIDAAVAAGARGIVAAGTGAGVGTPAEESALRRARAAGVAVCVSSRTGSGRVVPTPGRAEAGYVAADDLLPWKARILLALALTVTTDPSAIQRLFNDH